MRETETKYADIIDMPHPKSRKHPHMSNYDRAAQFSPFAALTGHEAAIKETARLTERRIDLDEYEKIDLNAKLQQLAQAIFDAAEKGCSLPEAAITYFQKDGSKDGGAYVTRKGAVKKIDEYRHLIVMLDMVEINIEDIINVVL